jgi:hypothetical protein
LGKGVDRFTFEESTTEEESASPFQGGRRSSIIEMGQDFDPSIPLSQPLAAHMNGLGRFGTPRTPGLAGVGAARLWEEMEIQNQMLAQANAPFGSGPIHQIGNGNGNGNQSIDFDNREMLSPLATAIIPGPNGSFQPNSNSFYPPISASHQAVESNSMPSNLQVFETLRARQALIESKDSKLSMLPGSSNDYPNHPRTKLNEKIAKWWANSSIELQSQVGGDEEIEILNDGLTPLPKTLEKKSNRQRKEVQRFKDEEEMEKIPKLRRIKSDVQSEISEVTSISAVQVDGNLKNPYLGKDVSIITPVLLQQQQQMESESELVNSYYQLAHDQEEKLDSDSFSDEKNATIYFGELPQLDTSEEEIESPKKRKEKSTSSSSKKSSRESRRSSKATTRTETSLPPSYKTEGSSSGDEEEEGFRSQSRARTTRSSTTRSTASSTSVQTSLFDDAQVQIQTSKKRSSNVDIAERAQLANQQWGVGAGEKTLRSLEKIERKSKKLENRREQRRRSRELNIKAARDMSLGEVDQLEAAEIQR